MNSIDCPIAQAAARNGKGIAVTDGKTAIAFAEFDREIRQYQARLSDLGVSSDTRIAILAETSRKYVALLFALWRSGVAACPMSPRLPMTQIKDMLGLIECPIVIDDTQNFAGDTLKSCRRLTFEDLSASVSHGEGRATDGRWNLEQPATIVFTSGSSGFPKAALHSLANHYYSAMGSNENIPVQEGDRWLLSLPLYHVGGLAILFRSALAGATIVLPDSNLEFADIITRNRPTHVSMVHTQLYRILKDCNSSKDAGSLKAILLGGSSVPQSLVENGWRAGLPIYLSYGLTETASQVTTTGGEHVYTSGQPLKYREVSTHADGEILVKGEVLFQGYLEGDAVTPAVDENGWFHTGDVGEFDLDGRLHVIGRKDNMFITGGENIYPEEIEAALLALPQVVQAVVVPVKNPEFGYRPVAFVRTEPPRKITAEDLSSLPTFKRPIQYYDWPRKYETGGIKLDRRHFHKLVKDMYEHF